MVALNPLGAVILGDGANPRSWSAKAREAVSGGEFVTFSGANGKVGSDSSSFATSDIEVAVVKTSTQDILGYCVSDGASGAIINYATRGIYPMRAIGSVTGGKEVKFVSGTIPGVTNVLSGSDVNGIGRAVASAASGTNNFAPISLNL